MILCSIGHGEFPDLNFRLAPSCHIKGNPSPSILLLNKPLKQETQNAFKPLFFFENVMAGPQSFIPKKGEIKILQNNTEAIEDFSKDKNSKIIFEVSLQLFC